MALPQRYLSDGFLHLCPGDGASLVDLYRMRPAVPLYLLFHLFHSAASQTKIKCFECLSPFGATELPESCQDEDKNFCMGLWCTKGRDDQANGVYHGCANVAPVDERRPQCKDVIYRNSYQGHTNCYCNNVEFCNFAAIPVMSSILTIFASVLMFF